jgi:hypothetical protein
VRRLGLVTEEQEDRQEVGCGTRPVYGESDDCGSAVLADSDRGKTEGQEPDEYTEAVQADKQDVEYGLFERDGVHDAHDCDDPEPNSVLSELRGRKSAGEVARGDRGAHATTVSAFRRARPLERLELAGYAALVAAAVSVREAAGIQDRPRGAAPTWWAAALRSP